MTAPVEREDLGEGILLLALNTPGPVTALSSAVNAALIDAVDAALGDARVKGLVLSSRKDDFASGGDIEELRRLPGPEAAELIVAPFIAMLRRMETAGKPAVAALNGSALGGGLELALACHHRIASYRPKAIFGLPEATLGLLPGAGGTQRLPRLIGLQAGGELILRGRTLSAEEARAAGIIDELVEPEALLPAAKAWALAHPAVQQPWDRKGYRLPDSEPQSVAGRQFFIAQWARARARSAGNDPASTAILHALHHGLQRDLDAGIAIETRHFARIAPGVQTRNRIRTGFLGPRAVQARARQLAAEHPVELRRIGVVGGGVMGRGIALAAARAGLQVTLLDASPAQAEAARAQLTELLDKQIARGGMPAAERDGLLARIQSGADYGLLAAADLVIEAVFERMDVKHEVLRNAQAATRPGVPLASNTSTLAIGELARAVSPAGRMIGMHFFAPAERMPLLEVITTRATSARTLSTALRCAELLRKTAIVVKDGPGFFTSRIVSCYSAEALTMLAEGVPAALIDNVAINAGMALGPLALADLTKLDLLRDIMASMSRTRLVAMRGNRAVEALDRLLGAGRTGRPAGAGIYDYADGRQQLWPGLPALFPARVPALAPEIVRQRLFHSQALDAVRALADGTLANATDGDCASVQGWGFPIHLGGVLSYIDTVGIERFTREAAQLARQFGARFRAPGLLRRMAREGQRFHER